MADKWLSYAEKNFSWVQDNFSLGLISDFVNYNLKNPPWAVGTMAAGAILGAVLANQLGFVDKRKYFIISGAIIVDYAVYAFWFGGRDPWSSDNLGKYVGSTGSLLRHPFDPSRWGEFVKGGGTPGFMGRNIYLAIKDPSKFAQANEEKCGGPATESAGKFFCTLQKNIFGF